MTKELIIKNLQEIKNIGPKMAIKLYNAGVYSHEQMFKLGTEDVYLLMHFSGCFCGRHHVAYLYAIEGAITNFLWTDIPKSRKIELKKFIDTLN